MFIDFIGSGQAYNVCIGTGSTLECGGLILPEEGRGNKDS